jgi:hypothetical protein
MAARLAFALAESRAHRSVRGSDLTTNQIPASPNQPWIPRWKGNAHRMEPFPGVERPEGVIARW